MYFKKIVGEKVYLSPRDSDDCMKYVEWLNNYEIAKYVDHHINIITMQAEKEYLANSTNNNNYDFAIVDKDTNELIGSISLMNIKNVHRTAELGIFIGDEDHLSHGYGSEAIMLLLDYGFNQLNLNNVYLKLFSFNKRAFRAYEKCGFKTFGVWKKSHYFEGKYHDIIFMNVLRDDFNKKKKLYKV